MKRYLGYRPGEIPMVYRLLDLAAAGRPGHCWNLLENKGFLGLPLSGFEVAKQLLVSFHLKERNKMLLRSILCGGVRNVFLLGKTTEEDAPCQFCGCCDGDGHLFWNRPFSTLVCIREPLNLHHSFPVIAARGPGAWPGMGGYPLSLPAGLISLGPLRQ